MLNAFPVEFQQELLNLSAATRLLVERDADHAIGCSHGARGQPGIFPLDIEIADFPEIENALIKQRPVIHAPAVDVVGEVIDEPQPVPDRMAINALDEIEIDIINGAALLKARSEEH